MRKYETMYIINPALGEEGTEAVIEKMSNVITSTDGEIIKQDKMGIKELAYEIKDNPNGYYVLVNFNGQPSTVSELERIFKIDDNVLRYLILKED